MFLLFVLLLYYSLWPLMPGLKILKILFCHAKQMFSNYPGVLLNVSQYWLFSYIFDILVASHATHACDNPSDY